MVDKTYKLQYLPLFKQDLFEIVDYIANYLHNKEAANKLVNDVENAIIQRLKCPTAFETYISSKKRSLPYYRIYVNNYVIFYVVIDDVMEVRRILYKSRDFKNVI